MPFALVAAFALLTRLPLGRAARHDAATVAAAVPFYPFVGAVLGAFAGALAELANGFVPPLVAAALIVAALTALTGALHQDAVADTADALGGWSREDRLRIMRDHSIGAYGATALCFALVLEVAAVAALIDRDATVALFVAVTASSRAVAAPLAALLPYARLGERGTTVPDRITCGRAACGLALGGLLSSIAGVDGLLILAAALAVATGCGLFYRRWIGGVTGDALGAAIQLAQLAGLVTAVSLQ